MRIHALILWLTLVAVSFGQDPLPINVVGPSSPIQKQALVFITVENLSEEEFLASTITVVPPKGAIAFRIWGAPMLVFQGNEPGRYTVTVGKNVQHVAWKQSLSAALSQAKGVNVPDEFLLRLSKLDTDAAMAFPSRGGSCVVEVAGSVPPPIDPPVDPPPPTTKVTKVTYVFEKDNNNIPRPVAFALQRINAESSGKIIATEFEEDTVDGSDGQTPDQYVIALKAAREAGLPALVVQAGATVVRVIKNPTTEQQVRDAVK